MEDQELENEHIARGLMPDIPLEEAVDMLTTDTLRKRTSVADESNQVTADESTLAILRNLTVPEPTHVNNQLLFFICLFTSTSV